RRALGRRRDRGARLRRVRGLGGRHHAPARGLPMRARLPVLRPEPEMRQSERVPRQARRTDPPPAHVDFRVARSSYCRQSTSKEAAMQYLLLIHDDETQDNSDLMPEYVTYTEALVESGSFLGANQLQPSDTATTVRVRDGETLVTDGPFIETKESLGGYYLVDAESLDEAIEWAAKTPSARSGHIEVRPVV